MRWLSGVVRWWILIASTVYTITIVDAKEKAVCAELIGSGGVGIRVWPTLKASPLRLQHHLTFRLVQINWEAEEITEGDWIGIFPKDPRPPMIRSNPLGLPMPQNQQLTPWDMPAPLFWDTPYATQGQRTSNVTQGRIELQMLAAGGCVGVWAGFIRNGLAIAADCLASHPNWLWQNRDVLGSRALRSLIIPGTHNSGSFTVRDDDDVVSAWVVCQDEDVISQLLYGNRYLDLRVAYYPHTPELLWVNHDLVQWRPLKEVLNDVRTFLTLSRDPVIIDIHRTPVGFEFPEAVPLLLSLMNNTFGKDFLPYRLGPRVTLDQIWSIGKRVIFAYIDAKVADEEEWIWPPLPQAWANAQMLNDLRHYLDGQMTLRQSSPRIWAAMAHLTPSFWDVILRSHIGVRGLSDRVNRPVSTWVRQRWAHLTNIVATDFFRGNNIINIAIRTNLALSVCPSESTYRPRYSYKSSYLRRSTETPGRMFTSSITIPRISFSESMRTRSVDLHQSSTPSPLLQTLSSLPHSSQGDMLPTTYPPNYVRRQFSQDENRGHTNPKNNKPPSMTSPIHALLDIFGFNTTNTSTIASRLIPHDQQDEDFHIAKDIVENNMYDYDPDLFSSSKHQREGGSSFSQSSRQLPLILEASMSITLQENDEDEDSQNSGDIPFKVSSTQAVFENTDVKDESDSLSDSNRNPSSISNSDLGRRGSP